MSSNVLKGLEPAGVFKYFEEICSIPHGSHHTDKISEYLADTARRLGLKFIQDEAGNVVIFVPASKGYEDADTVMLQGHMDMVCEKSPEAVIDFDNDGLTLNVNGDVITASGTTLGGDDGIALAYGLAIAESDDIPHPALELVFTVDEEVGMLGAEALDTSILKSKLLINLDNEEEGHLLVSCAGGATAICHLPYKERNVKGYEAVINISGLTGGHSGQEIDKYRANASVLLARLLYKISEKYDYSLIEVTGGQKDNAITREASARLVFSEDKGPMEFEKDIYELFDVMKNEYKATDKDMAIEVNYRLNPTVIRAMDSISSSKIILAMYNLPSGVQRMSQEMKGLVETSLNLGVVKTENGEVVLGYCVRSCVASSKRELLDRISSMMILVGGRMEIKGDYPSWQFKEDSNLLSLMKDVYKDMYGKEPIVDAIHAGVECGYFISKINGLDCVSIGPNLLDIHTPQESMIISSVKRTYEYLLEILKRLK